MSNISDKDIDKLFQEAAEKYDTSFDEEAWKNLEQKLDSAPDTGMGYFRMIGGIIALFIVGTVLIWWQQDNSDTLVAGQEVYEQQPSSSSSEGPAEEQLNEEGLPSGQQVTAGDHRRSTGDGFAAQRERQTGKAKTDHSSPYEPSTTGTTGGATPPDADERTALLPTADGVAENVEPVHKKQDANNNEEGAGVATPEKTVVEVAGQVDRETEDAGMPDRKGDDPVLSRSAMDGQEKDKSYSESVAKNGEPGKQSLHHADHANDDPEFVLPLGYILWQYPLPEGEIYPVAEEEIQQQDQREGFARGWTIKLSYSPDFSSIGYFKPDKPGGNLGLLTEFHITRRLAVSSGAIYSKKIYFTEETSGYGYGSRPESRLDADCRVVDIPVNISYYFQEVNKHRWYISGGASSYIMLKENYDYSVWTTSGKETSSEEFTNRNNHWFSILNLSFGYEKRLNNYLFLQVEPFLKAPMAGVGEGKVDLVSTGAFIHLKYRFKH